MKPVKVESPTVLPGDGLVPLESVLCTEELNRRPARAPDYEKENRALVLLAQALADSPRTILQKLADTILEVFDADSAGISLLTRDEKRFYWPAIAGLWKPHLGGGTPREFGPCGDVLDRNAPQLFRHFERRYTYFLPVTPPVEECLLVPFYVQGKAVGTIWAIAHDDRRKFDAEDMRQLLSLGRFASAAYQSVAFPDALEQRDETLRQNHAELGQSLAKLREANLQAEDSRRAALNLMEDAVLSRQAAETLNLKLRESERRFREMIAALPAAIYTTDAEGRLRHFNQAAVELSGRVPELGTDRWCASLKLCRPDGAPLPYDESPMAITLMEGRIARGEEMILERPDGTRIWFTAYPTPLRDAENRIAGGINMLVDITERRRAEMVTGRLAAIVESSDDAIISKNLDGVITSWNGGAERLFGYTAQEAIGQSITMLIPPERLHEEPKILGRLMRGERMDHFETVRVRKDGSPVEISLTISPIKDPAGRVIGASKIAHDITERRQAEDERERLLKSEREARQQADEANRVKDEFFATVSHELRTPLNAMMGWAALLHRGVLDHQTTVDAAATIVRNARVQNQLISDLLDVSRIISGKLRLEMSAVELISVIEAAMDTVRPAADAKGVELILLPDQAPGLVWGDAGRLQQVVWNLLSNAIKYSPKGGRVDVRLKVEGANVAIIVRDTGEGIRPESLPYIFDRFRQVDSATTRRHGGLGLGLSIVRHLVGSHFGSVHADSEGPGHGATFTVTLPAMPVGTEASIGGAALQGAPAPVQTPSPENLKGLRVLVVDDEPDARELLSLTLTRGGAEVKAGATVVEALEILGRWIPDVLVADIGMPGEDGYTLIKTVRALEAERGGLVPALALTGYAGDKDVACAREAGFQMHLPKPAEPEILLAAVESLGRPGARSSANAGVDRRPD